MNLRERLWQLAVFAESQNRIAAEEVHGRLEVLNVRSRKRAGSIGAFRVGVSFSLQNQYGFAVPFKSSPLAKFSWTAEDLENEDETELETASSRCLFLPTGFPTFLRPCNLSRSFLRGTRKYRWRVKRQKTIVHLSMVNLSYMKNFRKGCKGFSRS
jgi:hypothetical protein